MSVEFNQLSKSFDDALQHKEDGNFNKDDIDHIYEAATQLFDKHLDLKPKQVKQLTEKLAKLAEVDKTRAKKKLQGTSRADAIRSMLQSVAKGK